MRFFIFTATKKELILFGIAAALFISAAILFGSFGMRAVRANTESDAQQEYIKWLEFDLRLSSLERALKHDISSFNSETPLCWIELLAYAATRNWGNVREERKINEYIDSVAKRLSEGATIKELTEGLELFAYFHETYYAVLSGF